MKRRKKSSRRSRRYLLIPVGILVIICILLSVNRRTKTAVGNLATSAASQLFVSGSFHLGDRYTVMLQLTEPYQNYQAEMTAFNSAVDSFFSDIDTTQAAPWLALRVHDKLNSLVSYDWELADAVTDTGSASFDLSYSAYGALVADSRGDANTALCDGYTYAYQYLLQQVGIPVVRVTGKAGKSADDLQPHSWTVISLDGEWYETDPTWDDIEPDLNSGDADQTIVQAAVSDTAYWNRVCHYMYDLTTEQISNYTADDS